MNSKIGLFVVLIFVFHLYLFVVYLFSVVSAHRAGWDSGIKCMEQANGDAKHIKLCKE